MPPCATAVKILSPTVKTRPLLPDLLVRTYLTRYGCTACQQQQCTAYLKSCFLFDVCVYNGHNSVAQRVVERMSLWAFARPSTVEWGTLCRHYSTLPRTIVRSNEREPFRGECVCRWCLMSARKNYDAFSLVYVMVILLNYSGTEIYNAK